MINIRDAAVRKHVCDDKIKNQKKEKYDMK